MTFMYYYFIFSYFLGLFFFDFYAQSATNETAQFSESKLIFKQTSSFVRFFHEIVFEKPWYRLTTMLIPLFSGGNIQGNYASVQLTQVGVQLGCEWKINSLVLISASKLIVFWTLSFLKVKDTMGFKRLEANKSSFILRTQNLQMLKPSKFDKFSKHRFLLPKNFLW